MKHFFAILSWVQLNTRTNLVEEKLHESFQNKVVWVLSDPHTGKALVIANQSRNVRSNIKRSDYSAVRAAYRSLAAFFIDLRPKWSTVNCDLFVFLLFFSFFFGFCFLFHVLIIQIANMLSWLVRRRQWLI